MFRFSLSRLYTTGRSINNWSGAEHLDTNRRKLYRYQQNSGVGQNLSDRYLRLEKSLRGKKALPNELYGYSHNSSSVIQSDPSSKSSSTKPLQIFHGFEIPEEPKPPADDGMFLFFFLKPILNSPIILFLILSLRMLYVWMRSLRLWSSWRSAEGVQGCCYVSTELAFCVTYFGGWMAFLHP